MPPSDSIASLHQGAGPDGLRGELVIGALHAGQREQIFGQPVHAAGVLEDDAQKLTRRGSALGVGSSTSVST